MTNPTMTFHHPEARRALLARARHLVECAARGVSPTEALPAAIAAIPCHGLFVTLKRGHQLRGCIGNYQADASNPVSALLDQTGPSATVNDWRFPPVGAEELPFLTIEITPMHAFQSVAEKGERRSEAVQIGRHGLIIRRGAQRGLLLPQVAVENGWDATTFLTQVCAKAGLPDDAWLADDSELTTFEGDPFSAPSPQPEVDTAAFSRAEIESVAALASAVITGKTGTMKVPASLVQTCVHPLGVIVDRGGCQSFALRSGASLGELIREAAGTPDIREPSDRSATEVTLQLLSLPIALRPADYPARHGMARRGAVLARLGESFAIALPGPDADPVPDALKSIGFTVAQWPSSGAEVVAFQKQSIVFRLPDSGTPAVRPSARAGQFYPGTADEIRAQLDGFFAKTSQTGEKPARAVMLPHAGWIYCGDLIAGALAPVRVPEIAVVIGPKHTPHGANWSVSASSAWQLPGMTVPVATEWAEFLVQRCPGLVRETDAHREEHGCEVLLPFLLRKNPGLKIVPIAIGAAGYDDLEPLASALSALRAELGDRLLLVISSDMNHFAEDTENRRRDALALEKFKVADSRGLFEVCRAEDISMCGLRPAVAVLRALEKERVPEVEITGYDTSARVSGDTNRVVGYAGAVIR